MARNPIDSKSEYFVSWRMIEDIMLVAKRNTLQGALILLIVIAVIKRNSCDGGLNPLLL
jgi:hypothetical protein